MKKCYSFVMLLVISVLAYTHSALAEEAGLTLSASAEGSTVYILEPADGAVVPTTFTIKFGLRGMGVSPAGIERANTGHHHLLINVDALPALDQPLGGDVKHFGGGQTETELTLEPGKHTLQLIFADHRHVPHNPPLLSQKITITVLDQGSGQQHNQNDDQNH